MNTEVKKVTKNITKPDIPPPKEREKSNNSIDDSACWESQDSEDDHKDIKTKNKKSQGQATSAYPEPRLPFPCVSSLTCKEHVLYLQALTSKSRREPPQVFPQNILQTIKC